MRAPFRFLFSLLLLVCTASPLRAEVVVTFWSHDRDQSYEHAFIVMRGTVESTGERVDTNIGFTARSVSPLILMRSVQGEMQTLPPAYVARSTSRPHFSITLDDAGYARLTAFIARWRGTAQPNYNLNRRNCVHFVMDAAAALGLSVNRQSQFFRRPRQFLEEVMGLNPRLRPASR